MNKACKRNSQFNFHASQLQSIGCKHGECKYSSKDKIEFASHNLSIHGDILQSQLEIKIVNEDSNLGDLDPIDLQQLSEANLIKKVDSNKYIISREQQDNIPQILIVRYRQSLIAATKYYLYEKQFKRLCFVEGYFIAKKYKIELFILYEELQKYMEYQRVTEIFQQLSYDDANIFKFIRFFELKDEGKLQILESYYKLARPLRILSRYTKCCLSALISDIKTPFVQFKSRKANILRDYVEEIKRRGIQSMLEQYLDLQIKRGGAKKNIKAKLSDQALTTKFVFDRIYSRILVTKSNMFDCCPFVTDWDSQTHYNSLSQSWHGNFVWCNPPYSIAAQFVTKSLIEFLKGRSIILLVPQPRVNDGYVPKLLSLLGDVHKEGLIRFDPFKDVVHTPLQLIYLIQPDHLEFIEAYHKYQNNPSKDKQFVSMNILQKSQYIQREKEEVATRLLKQNQSVNSVQKIVGIARKTVEKLSRALNSIANK